MGNQWTRRGAALGANEQRETGRGRTRTGGGARRRVGSKRSAVPSGAVEARRPEPSAGQSTSGGQSAPAGQDGPAGHDAASAGQDAPAGQDVSAGQGSVADYEDL